MNVPESFVDLIYSADNHQNYIGMGNPNAKIPSSAANLPMTCKQKKEKKIIVKTSNSIVKIGRT